MQNETNAGGQPIIEVFLPTFRMEPDEDERFYPSQAKKLAQAVVENELNGQEFEEDDVKAWTLSIGDKVRDSVKGKCKIVLKCVCCLTMYIPVLYQFICIELNFGSNSFTHLSSLSSPTQHNTTQKI